MQPSRLVLASMLVGACTDGAITLDHYPAQAPRILAAAAAFEPTATGFAIAVPEGFTAADVRAQLGVVPALPIDGSSPIELTTGDLRVAITADGLSGTGELHGGAVAYTRARGTSYFMATAHVFEEWLLLEAPQPGVAASWRIRGASAVQDGARVLLVDAAGLPRIEVTAPEAYLEDGTQIAVTLLGGGDRISLVLPAGVAGARSILVDPVWRTVGNMDVPRWSLSLSLLPDGRALAIGGKDPDTDEISQALGTRTRYEPATGAWTADGTQCIPFGNPRVCIAQHGAVTMRDGSLMLTGGLYNESEINASAFRIDPVTGAYTGSWMYASATQGQLAAEASSTLLADGRVLVVGGHHGLANGGGYCDDCTNVSVILNHGAIYDPATAAWTTAAPGGARARHTATLLPDGRVLIAGGVNTSATALTSARIFNPASSTYTSAAAMATARQFHTATLLHDGRVVVAGGMSSAGFSLSTTEIYTPATNTWAAGPSLATSRMRHTATLLPNGRVVVVAGRNQTFTGSYLTSSEIFDPVANSWAAGPALTGARDRHVAQLMPDGRVLVTGGRGSLFGADFPLSTSRVLETAIAQHPATPDLASARRFATAATLATGRVLVAGGEGAGGTALATAQLYDAPSNTLSATGSLVTARRHHTATTLADGRVLVVGGDTAGTALATAELYSVAAGTFAQHAATARKHHTATLLESGGVLACGGTGAAGSALAACDVFAPATSTWSAVAAMTSARTGHRAVLLRDNRVLVVGGNAGATTAELYDPATNTWAATGALANHGTHFAIALLPSGKVLASGGDTGSWLTLAQLFDPATATWTATTAMNNIRRNHTLSVLPSGRVLAFGGGDPDIDPAGVGMTFVEEYDPATATWTKTLILFPQSEHAAALIPSGDVLVVGGQLNDYLGGTSPTTVVERYDEGRGAPTSQRPSIGAMPAIAAPAASINVTGVRFTGNNREATGGTYNDSHANFPLLELTRLDNQAQTYARTTAYTATAATFALPTLQRGLYLARIVVNGMVSDGKLLTVQ